MTASLIFAGAFIGGFLGYLARPSAFLVGQLPFIAVITRGASLEGLESILYPVAVESFNYLIFGVFGGGIIGGIIGSQIDNINQQKSKREEVALDRTPDDVSSIQNLVNNTTDLVLEADPVTQSEYPTTDERKRAINRSLVGFPKEFIIACVYCGQKIRGDSKACPLCDTLVPDDNRKRMPNYSAKVSSYSNEKECPYCAEMIKVDAIKCKHCGSMLPIRTEDIEVREEPNQLYSIQENKPISSPPPSVDNFCTNCGATRESNDQQFCTKCGKKFYQQ